MSVRAVTEQVAKHRAGLQFYSDATHFDAMTDEMATGTDIYSSDEEIPAGRGLRRYQHLSSPAGSAER